MKKTFQSPALRTIEVKAQSLMAASAAPTTTQVYHNTGAGSQLSREVNFYTWKD